MALTDKRFAGKSVLITGGSRGIGRACAIAFARNGADVAINYNRSEEEAKEVMRAAENEGVKSQIFRADTSKSSEVGAMVEEAFTGFGKIDILVNNAGVLKRTPFLEISEEEWDWIVQVDLKGYFLVGQAVARHMVEEKIRGSIVNISSNNQERVAANVAHYNVAKAGVAMLTKSMALELAPYGIRVNSVAPGLTDTDMNHKDIANPEWREGRMSRIPLKVIATPEDVTGAVLFLASDDAKLTTGTTVWTDAGGMVS
jgi:glucose 1-dehydrogenase